MNQLIAADIGGSHISSTIVNTERWTMGQAPIQQTKVDAFGPRAPILSNWADNLNATATYLSQTDKIQLAIAMPGPFHYDEGLFSLHPEGKLGSLAGTTFGSLMEDRFSLPIEVVFENDAACFGLGEALFGAGKGKNRVLSITLGTGIGSCFIQNGSIVKKGPGIPSGGELYAEPFADSIADDYFTTRWFVRKAKNEWGIESEGVRELLQVIPEQERKQLFREFGENLFSFLTPFTRDFQPEAIIIGGNIAKTWSHFSQYLEPLFEKKHISVLQSSMGEQAVFLGAAKVFQQKNGPL